ncbi:MAG: Fe-S cluster assembly protein SufD [Holophaga sp.]|nr:Fe-S cluster assembly protein SufD [Holophaga sp.]
MAALTECCLLSELLAAPRPAEWEVLRRSAEARLQAQELPTLKDEDWKYTDLKALRETAFTPGVSAEVGIAENILPEAVGTRLVFVNGHFAPRLSNTSALPPGVRMLPLATASAAAGSLGALATPESSDIFANLNHARFTDGAYLFVPRNVRVEAPLHVLFLSHQEGAAASCSLPRLLVVLERGAQAQIVEEYLGRGQYLTNAVVEVHLHENANLTHERVQRESKDAIHIATLAARVDKGARYVSRTLSLGARLSRQTPKVRMAEESAELELHGLALLDQDQVADTHSLIDHLVPHCSSRQLHKTIVDGRSRGIFNGKIFVHPGAQQTDAQQQARSLLLSDHARVDAKPELEIYADDVKCAHGAAIGQLDPEELFYLQSRGLNLETARNLLTYGFAAELLAAIPVLSLRRQLRRAVMARTNASELEVLA